MATVSEFLVKIRGDVKDLTDKLQSVEKSVDRFAKNLTASVGAAFAVDRLIEFGKQSVLLAAKAEGITNAFKRLNDATLLSELREATRGTISDVELMRGAVQANNFQIPLDNLASLFKFASIRARETGESVDFLVNSIVMGIARKSPMILDNLGINIKRIQTEFAKTGDFAQAATQIVNEELAKSGDIAIGAADKISQWGVVWERFSLETGKGLIDTMTGLGDAFIQLGNIFKPITDLFRSTGEETHIWSTLLRILTGTLEVTVRGVTAILSPLRWLMELFEKIISIGIVKTFNDIVDSIKSFIGEGSKLAKVAAAFGITFLTVSENVKGVDKNLSDAEDTFTVVEQTIMKTKDATKKLTEGIKDSTIAWDEWLKRMDETPEKLKVLFRGFDVGKLKEANEEMEKMPAERKPMAAPEQTTAGFEMIAPDPSELFTAWTEGMELTKTQWDEMVDYMIQQTATFTNVASQLWGQFNGILQQGYINEQIMLDNNYAKDLKRINTLSATEVQLLKEKEKARYNMLSDSDKKLYDAEKRRNDAKAKLEEDYKKKTAEIKTKMAKADKAAAVIRATMDTISASVAALKIDPSGILSTAVATMGAIMVAKIKAQPIPTFAEGGIISGTTIGMLGEYSGARSNPEVVAPLDKLKTMMGFGKNMKLETVIRGEEIYLVLNRNQRRKKYST